MKKNEAIIIRNLQFRELELRKKLDIYDEMYHTGCQYGSKIPLTEMEFNELDIKNKKLEDMIFEVVSEIKSICNKQEIKPDVHKENINYFITFDENDDDDDGDSDICLKKSRTSTEPEF